MKFRKKPVIIEAFQWTGDSWQKEDPQWIIVALKLPFDEPGAARLMKAGSKDVYMEIRTLEGVRKANRNDYIIQGVKKELYSCKPDIFEMIYEKVLQ